jgi:prepilin-type N-terminal cleavage/methylation domain-containing protein
MRHDTKVQSFSLVEMLVVLVLSGIVLSILYFAYYSISTYQFELVAKVDKQEELGLLFYSLKRDIDRSYMLRKRDQFAIDCYSAPEKVDVSYYFVEPNVVRKQLERTDTFHCEILRSAFLFQEIPVTDNAVIDQIRLTLNTAPDPIELDIIKLYDAACLINAIPNDTTRERNQY